MTCSDNLFSFLVPENLSIFFVRDGCHGGCNTFFKRLVYIATWLCALPDGFNPLSNVQMGGIYPAAPTVSI
jgi:hypothetical protein